MRSNPKKKTIEKNSLTDVDVGDVQPFDQSLDSAVRVEVKSPVQTDRFGRTIHQNYSWCPDLIGCHAQSRIAGRDDVCETRILPLQGKNQVYGCGCGDGVNVQHATESDAKRDEIGGSTSGWSLHDVVVWFQWVPTGPTHNVGILGGGNGEEDGEVEVEEVVCSNH